MDWQGPVPLKGLLLFPHRVLRMVHYLRASSDHRSSIFSLEGGLDWSPTARVQRGPSETARCTSTGDRLAPSPPPSVPNIY
jgi:hypothetical protein